MRTGTVYNADTADERSNASLVVTYSSDSEVLQEMAAQFRPSCKREVRAALIPEQAHFHNSNNLPDNSISGTSMSPNQQHRVSPHRPCSNQSPSFRSYQRNFPPQPPDNSMVKRLPSVSLLPAWNTNGQASGIPESTKETLAYIPISPKSNFHHLAECRRNSPAARARNESQESPVNAYQQQLVADSRPREGSRCNPALSPKSNHSAAADVYNGDHPQELPPRGHSRDISFTTPPGEEPRQVHWADANPMSLQVANRQPTTPTEPHQKISTRPSPKNYPTMASAVPNAIQEEPRTREEARHVEHPTEAAPACDASPKKGAKDIPAVLDELQFDTALQQQCNFEVDGKEFLQCREFFQMVSKNHRELTADDLHALLQFFTPIGVAPQEAADFLWEDCGQKVSLNYGEFLRYGNDLRCRLHDSSRFIGLCEDQKLFVMYTRVYPGIPPENTDGVAIKLLTASQEQSSGRIRAGVRRLRLYEHAFLTEFGSQYPSLVPVDDHSCGEDVNWGESNTRGSTSGGRTSVRTHKSSALVNHCNPFCGTYLRRSRKTHSAHSGVSKRRSCANPPDRLPLMVGSGKTTALSTRPPFNLDLSPMPSHKKYLGRFLDDEYDDMCAQDERLIEALKVPYH